MAEDYTGEAIIEGVALTDSEVDYYTAPRKMILSEIHLSHSHTAEVAVTVYIKSQGDSAGVANKFLPAVVVQPNIPAPFYSRTIVSAGSTISALCSVTGVVSMRASAAVATA